MNLNDGMILTFIVIGIIIIIVSFILSKYEKFIEDADMKKLEALEDEKADYEEVRNKILELNEYGEFLKGDLERKHKELLFLYQLISEKQKEIDTSSKNTESSAPDLKLGPQSNEFTKIDINKSEEGLEQGPKLDHENKNKNHNKEIIDLSLAGYNSNEIAKKLNIGKGQVNLVLNLYK